jgi:hypothetical protein
MAMKQCTECKTKISTDANPCPHCGKKNPHGSSKIVVIGGGFLALAAVIWVLGGGLHAQVEDNAAQTMGRIEQKVAADSVAQYEIAKRGGTAIDVCVHAGFVSAAFLQAKDETNYQKWKAIEKTDCDRAGVPR